jgi:hypothetical protein
MIGSRASGESDCAPSLVNSARQASPPTADFSSAQTFAVAAGVHA